MKINLKIVIGAVLSLVGLLSGLLSISRYSGLEGEDRAIVIWLRLFACFCFYCFYRLIRPWSKRWFRILVMARSISRLLPTETGLKRLEAWIKRHAPERPAEMHEVNLIVSEAPMLQGLDAKLRTETLDRFREEILKAQLIWFRWHEIDRQPFDFDFDSFRFLNPDSSNAGLARTTHHFKDDILRRFSGKQFHTIVYILRGNNNPRMGRFFEELKEIMRCGEFIGFPLDPARRRGASFVDELVSVCANKSILLVDPLLTDGGIDEAYATITKWGGIVNGVVIMFQVQGIELKKLASYEKLQQKCGQPELRGQVILDLQSPLTEAG